MGASVSRREGGVRLCGYRERSLGSSPADLPSAGPGPSGPLNKNGNGSSPCRHDRMRDRRDPLRRWRSPYPAAQATFLGCDSRWRLQRCRPIIGLLPTELLPASPSVCGPRCVHAGSDCFGLVPTKRAIVGDDGRSDEHVSNLGRSISTRASAFTLAVIADTRRTLKSRCRLGSAGDCSASMRWARSSCREAGFRFFWLHVVSSLHVLAEVVRRAGAFVACSHNVGTATPPSSGDITNVCTQPGPGSGRNQRTGCVLCGCLSELYTTWRWTLALAAY